MYHKTPRLFSLRKHLKAIEKLERCGACVRGAFGHV